MAQKSFGEYYKRNKVVVWGLIAIVAVLTLRVLVPPKSAKNKTETPTQQASAKGKDAVIDRFADKPPINQPTPLAAVAYPVLSKNIESRFNFNRLYDYEKSKAIFKPTLEEKAKPRVFEQIAEVFEIPDITYHGFFAMGRDRVAILKLADKLTLAKAGAAVNQTQFEVRAVLPERVIMADNKASREFEIALSEETSKESESGS